MDRHTPEKKSFKPQDLSATIDLVEENLARFKGTSYEGLLKEPFETVIDRKSINKENLRRYAKLKIECEISQDNKGRMIFHTGSPGGTMSDFYYTFPDRRKGFMGMVENFLGITEVKEQAAYADNINTGIYMQERINISVRSGKYTVHQHPSGNSDPSFGSREIPIGDIQSFSNSKSQFHFIVTGDIITVVSRISPTTHENLKKDPSMSKLIYEYKGNLFAVKKFSYESQEADLVVRILNSENEEEVWEEVKKDLTY
jgi:hypothetical protein